MALIKCSKCGHDISDKAEKCIHCGCPIKPIIKCEECGHVLKEDDKVIGYAGMWIMFDSCDLVNIAISKDYQGKGYGEKLLRFMIKRALQLGIEFMHLEVRVSNLKAYELYRKYDFEEVRIRKGYYSDGEDCKDMVKGLLGLSEEDFSD